MTTSGVSRVLGLLMASLAPFAAPASAATLSGNAGGPLKDVHSGLCMGIKGSSTASGALIQAQHCDGSPFQTWKLVRDSAGYAQIVNAGSGMCLDVPGATKERGTNLQQWGCGSADNQKWNPSDQGNGQVALISKTNGLAVDVHGAGTVNGTRIIQWTWSGASNQRWTLPSSTPAADGGPVGFGRTVTGGAGGQRVRVTTADALEKALCSSNSGGTCTDTTPRIIEVAGVIDFTGSEGPATGIGCYTSVCPAPMRSERILDPNMSAQCAGKPQISISYDKAGSMPLLVGSNKTVIGIGASSGIKGRGLRLRGGASNIAIRNLAISDINAGIVWGGDAITLDDTDRVWIDHNYFSRIGRQMIVAGWGKASNVTISNNEFDGRSEFSVTCNGAHYWNLLLIGANDSMSIVGNWLHHFSGRAPKIGTENGSSTVQLVNNYFEDGPGHALATAAPARVLVEGNYFKTVTTPISNDKGAGYVFAVLGTPTAAANSSCQAALQRPCVGNVVEPAPQTNRFTQDSAVLDTFKAVPDANQVDPYPAADVPARVRATAGPRASVVQ